MNDISTFLKALEMAAQRHRKQYRKGFKRTPYINHPIKVAQIISEFADDADFNTLIAAVLHDVVEDTVSNDAEEEALRQTIFVNFGAEVLSLVNEVTDNKKFDKHIQREMQIKNAPHLSLKAKRIKLADKIANLDDIVNNPPAFWPKRQIVEYINWSANVVAGLRGSNLKLEALFDQTFLKARNKIEK